MANADDQGVDPEEWDVDFHDNPGSPIAFHERVELKDVVDLLRTRLVMLTGGKDKSGAWLLTFPSSGQAKRAGDITFEKLKQMLTYLVQFSSADPEQDAFSAVIDARHDSWNFCKFIIKGLDHFLVGRIHVAYIVEPSGFWSKRTNNAGFKKARGQVTFETVLVASHSKLNRYIEMNQLTEELGGLLHYNHIDWIDIHTTFDRFMGNVQRLYNSMDKHHTDMSSPGLPTNMPGAEETLEKHHYLHEEVTALPKRYQLEGQNLLHRVLQPVSGQRRNLSSDLGHIVTRTQQQLEKISGKQELLEEVWELRLNQLEQCLQMKEFEEEVNKGVGWFEGPGNAFLSEKMPVGFSKAEAERFMHEHISFNSQAEKYFNQLSKLQLKAEQYIEENHYAIPEIRAKLQHIDSLVRDFKSRITLRGQQLALSAKFHSTAETTDDLLYDLGQLCSADHIAYDVEAAEQMVCKLKSTLDEATSSLEMLQQLGEGLLDLLQSNETGDGQQLQRRRSLSPRHSQVSVFRKVSRRFLTRIDELVQRKRSCQQVVDKKRSKLEQFLQLKSCEEDARKIIDWLYKAANLVQASQTDLGDSEESVNDLEQEHSEFASKSKATYENGIQLIKTGQVLREACELPVEPGMEQMQQLDAAWTVVAASIEERTNRLSLSAKFHKEEAKVLHLLSDLRYQMQQQIDLQTVADVEQLLEHYSHLWEMANLSYEEAKASGQALLKHLTVKFGDEVPAEIEGDLEAVLAMFHEKLPRLTTEWTAVQRDWLQKKDEFGKMLSIKEFTQACSEVMLWLEREINNLIQQTSFGGSLEDARQLMEETQVFQKDTNSVYDRVCKLTAVAKKEVDANSFCKDQFESNAAQLDHAWKEFSLRLLHWQSLLGMAVSFYEKVDDLERRLARIAKSFRTVQLERTYEGMQYLISQHDKLREQFTEATQQTLNEGQAFLQRLEHPEQELLLEDNEGVVSVDYMVAIRDMKLLLRKLQDESEDVEDMWTARKKALQQALQLRALEGHARVVATATDEQIHALNSMPLELSISAAGLLLLQEQHAQVEAAAKRVVRKMAEVTDEADSLVKSGHYASAEIKHLRKSLGQRVGRMARVVVQRREVLAHTMKFQKKANEWVVYMDELQRRMTTSGIAATRDSLVAMSEEHRIIRQEVECTGEELQRESRVFMTTVTGLAQTDCTKVEGFLGRMSERIVQLKTMWQERQRQLEVTREGYDYKDKVQETIEWIHRTAWDFFSSHRQLGHDLDSAQQKLREYEVFEEESKVIHNRVIVLYQQVDNLILGGDIGTDMFKYESERLLGEWQHFLNHLDKSSQLLILYLSFHNAARQFSLLLSEYEAFIEDLNEQVLHQQSTRETDAQLERCHQQTQNNASETDVRLRSFVDMATQYTVQISKTWPCLDTQPASIAAARLWTELKDREEQLETVWKMKKGYVEQEAEIQEFQQQTQKLLGWLHARGDAFFQQYGPAPPVDVQQAKQRQMQLVKFQNEAEEHLRHASTLLGEGEQLMQLERHNSSPLVSLVEQLRHGVEQFTRRITQYRAVLGSTLEFHQQKDDLASELRSLKEDLMTMSVPEDASEVRQMKADYEQRWDKCESLMDQLGVLVVEVKAHYGRQKRQKNPAASLDHLRAQFRQCNEMLHPCLEKLARTLKAIEFFTAVGQVRGMLREKADAFFSQKLGFDRDMADLSRQQLALNQFENDMAVLFNRVQQLMEEGNRRIMSDSSVASVITSQLESLQDSADTVNSQISEQRDILDLCSVLHKHALKASEWCDEAMSQFKETSNRGLSSTATVEDIQVSRHRLHSFFSDKEVEQRDQLRLINELASQIPTDEAQNVAEELIEQSKNVMERYRELENELAEYQEKRGGGRSVKQGVVMETEEEADSIFMSEESETSLEPFYEDDSPNEMPNEVPADKPPAVPVKQAVKVVKRRESRKNSRSSRNRETSFSTLIAATLGAFGGSMPQSDSLDEVAQEETPPAIPPRPKMFPSAQEMEVDEQGNGKPVGEQWEGFEDDTDFGGEDSKEKENRKALKKVGYVLEELVNTEREYVEKLSIIVKGFLPEMTGDRVPTILENKKGIIFANVEEIYNFHKVFVRDLEQFQNNPQQACMCFIREESKFWAYFPYCKNKARSQKVLDEYGGVFFDEIQKKLGLPLPLSSYLLEPIQRMTRYQLLLKQLVKYAEQAKLDCAAELQNAVNAMLRVPRTANDALNFELLVGFDMKNLDERKLLLQDTFYVWVPKAGEKLKKKGQEMQVFLHEDVVVFSKKEVEGKNQEQQQRYVFKNSFKTTSMGLLSTYHHGTGHQPDKLKFALTCGPKTIKTDHFVLQPFIQDQKKALEIKTTWTEEISNLLKRQLEAERTKVKEAIGKQRTLHPLRDVSQARPPDNIFKKPEFVAQQHDTREGLARPLSRMLSDPNAKQGTQEISISTLPKDEPQNIGVGEGYIAIHPHLASDASEASLQLGQRVEVLEVGAKPGWCLVCTEGTDTVLSMEGLVPLNCIALEQKRNNAGNQGTRNAEMQGHPVMPKIPEVRASPRASPHSARRLSGSTASSSSNSPRASRAVTRANTIARDKLSGKTSGPMSVSSPVVSLQRSSGQTSTHTSMPAPAMTIAGLAEDDFIVQFDYVADEESKTSVKRGQIVTVLDCSMPDWWLVSVPEVEDAQATEGYVPAGCLAKTQPQPDEMKSSVQDDKHETSSVQLSIPSQHSSLVVSQHTSSIISENTSSVVSQQHGSSVQPSIPSQHSSLVVSQHTSSIISENTSSVVSQQHGSIVSQQSGSVVSQLPQQSGSVSSQHSVISSASQQAVSVSVSSDDSETPPSLPPRRRSSQSLHSVPEREKRESNKDLQEQPLNELPTVYPAAMDVEATPTEQQPMDIGEEQISVVKEETALPIAVEETTSVTEEQISTTEEQMTGIEEEIAGEQETEEQVTEKPVTEEQETIIDEQPAVTEQYPVFEEELSFANELPENVYIVQRDYTGEDESRVRVKIGQRVEALDTSVPGWYLVQVEDNEMEFGQEGFIPSEFLAKTMPVVQGVTTKKQSFSSEIQSAISEETSAVVEALSTGGQSMTSERQSIPSERQSVTTERQSVTTERQSVISERQSVISERQSLASRDSTRQSMTSANSLAISDTSSLGRQSVASERQSVGLERQSVGLERQSVGLERQSVGLERQSVGLERLSMGLERESMTSDKQSVSSEKYSVGSEEAVPVTEIVNPGRQSMASERHSLHSDRQSVSTERQSTGSDRQSITSERQPVMTSEEPVPVTETLASPSESVGDETQPGRVSETFSSVSEVGLQAQPNIDQELSRQEQEESKKEDITVTESSIPVAPPFILKTQQEKDKEVTANETANAEKMPDTTVEPSNQTVEPSNQEEKPALKLDFRSELAAVLKRKLKSPIVDRRTLYKSTFLADDPSHEEPVDQDLESLPKRGYFYYAVAAYCPDDEHQLPLFKGQRIEIIDWMRNDWWLARIPNPVTAAFVEGWVPATYLKDQETYEQEQVANRNLAVLAELQQRNKGSTASDLYRAIADFTTDHVGTLSMTEGEVFKVLHQREGWWLVRTQREGETAKEGWVPASYLEKAVDRPIEEPDTEDADYVEQLNLAADFIKQILGGNWQSLDSDSGSSVSDEGTAGPVSIAPMPEQVETKKPLVQRFSASTVDDRSSTSSPTIAADGDSEHVALMKRLYVLEELQSTEKEYVEKLDYVLRNYYARMDDPSLPHFLRDKRDDLFANIEEIYKFHSTVFLNDLIACGDDALAVGQCFVKWEVKLQELYVTYCKNKPRSDAVLHDPNKSFFDTVQSQLKDRLNISDYLIRPVQRITKYQLLLRDLVKYTDRAGEDTSALETAYEGCVDVPRRANNAIALSMLVTEENIEKKYGDLLLQDTFVVSERRRSQDRHLFLFERLVLFCKIKRESLSASGQQSTREKISYLEKTRLNMDMVMLTTSVDNDPCKFMLTAGKNNDKYTIKARQRSVRDAWVKEIQNLLASQLLQVKSAHLKLRRQVSPGNSFSSPSQSPVLLSERRSKSVTLPVGSRSPMPFFTDSMAMSDGKISTTPGRTRVSRSSMRNIHKQANLNWVGLTGNSIEEDQETRFSRRKAFVKRKSELPGISIELVQRSEQTKASRSSQAATHIVVGETYVINEDIAMLDDELLLSGGEHVRVLSCGDGQGIFLVETKDGESGWVSQEHLRDERQAERLKYQEPPILSAPSDTVSCRRGDSACLKLSLVASPHVDIKWYLENEQLEVGGRYHMTSEQNSVYLEIADVSSEDNGVYKCVASNEYGLDACSINLEVQDVPGPPGPVIVSNVMAKSAQLTWTPPSNMGNLPVSHFTIEKRVVGDNEGQWEEVSSCCRDTQKVVFQLTSGDQYQFRVFAVNVLGKGPPSVSSDIKTRRRGSSTDGGPSPYTSRKVEVKEQPVGDYYRMQDEIAAGKYGPIRKCIELRSNRLYAAKHMSQLRSSQLEQALQELDTLNGLRHPHVISLNDAFRFKRDFILILELCEGGSLFEHIIRQPYFTENDASRYSSQIVSACSYLHECGIVHLDLKPENLMIERPDSDIVKLVGFNKAQRLKDEADIRIVFGNPEFVAPEVLSYDPVYTATDMWSVGVVVYVMLSGLSPFYSDSAQLFNHNIQAAAYSFNDDCFDIISIEAKKFIRQLLIADSRHRWTANDCLQSTWLQTPVPDTELDTTYLQEFVARRRGKETVAPPTPKRKASFAFVQPIRLRMASPELRDPCPPSFPAQIRDMFVDVGRTVNFICSVLGYPEPIVTWYRDGIELHPANDRRIKIRYGADVQSLIIANVERSDSGQYLCRAENRFGQAATTAALVVAVTPAAPYQPSANQLEHTTALVCWEAPTSQDNNPIMSYEIERRRTDQDTWEIAASDITSCSFICKGLLPGQEYQFRIIAVYKEGRSKPSDPTGVVAIDEHDASNDVVVQKQDPGRLYDMKGEIGRGQFGTVLKCEEKQTRRQFAAKHIGVVGQALSEDAKRELEVLQMTCHPRLALLEAAFQTETHLILIEELVDGGTLLNHLASFQEFTEEDAVFYIRQILEGLDYLHQRNIAYLDLKPENVLLTASHRDVKLIDFGEARIVTDWTTVSKNSSRLDFMAPEALNSRSVVTETDVWSVGIVIVTILAGMPPFLTATETETIEHICNLQFVDEKASFSPMSAQAEQCVRHMLVIEPSLRPSAADCTKLTWLKATAAQSGKRSATLVKTDRLKVFVVDRAAKFRLV